MSSMQKHNITTQSIWLYTGQLIQFLVKSLLFHHNAFKESIRIFQCKQLWQLFISYGNNTSNRQERDPGNIDAGTRDTLSV